MSLQALFTHQLSRKRALWVMVLGLGVALMMGCLGYLNTGLVQQANSVFYDYVQKHSATSDKAKQVLVVDIDERSLEAIGQWPWPRYKVASLVQLVSQMQPAVIGLDILFAEEDRMSLSNIQKAYKQDFNLDINLDHIPKALLDSDGYLGKVLADAGAVGAQYFYFDHQGSVEVSHPASFDFLGRTDLLVLHQASSLLNNVFRISTQLQYAGFLNVKHDQDGKLRRLPLLIEYQGAIYPHFSLAMLMQSLRVEKAFIQENSFGLVLEVGRYQIPITPDGFMMLNFSRVSHAYPTVSALDVLNGSVHKDVLRDKLVVIGSSAVGLQSLRHHTAVDAQFSAVKTHVLMLDNVVNQQVMIAPAWANIVTLLICMMIATLMSLLFVFTSHIALKFLTTLCLIVFIFSASWISVAVYHLLSYPAAPVITVLLLYMGFVIIHLMDVKEAKQTLELKYTNHLENTAHELSTKVIEQTKLLSDRNEALKESLLKLRSDTAAAAVIQQSMLPKKHALDALPSVDLAWDFKPCDDVGGDILNAFSLGDDHMGFFSLDVSGHGVQAAMLAVSLNFRLMERTVAGDLLVSADGSVREPSEVVTTLNKMFPMDLDIGQYFTMTYGVYNVRSRLLRYTQAGHPPMIICEPNRDVYVHVDGDLPVGLILHAEFRTHERYVADGTRLILYSDGLYEVGLRQPFDQDAIVKLMKQAREEGLQASVQKLVDVVDGYTAEHELIDDVSVLALELH